MPESFDLVIFLLTNAGKQTTILSSRVIIRTVHAAHSGASAILLKVTDQQQDNGRSVPGESPAKPGGIIMQTLTKTTFSGSSEVQASTAPLPTATHQGITGCLFTEISVYLKAREPQCRIMAAPFAVFLKNAGNICLQPDITVVQDESKLDEEGCHGAPDWVIEVVSPASRKWDYGQKLGIYINAGVREYWIVDSEKKLIVAYCLEHPDVPAIYQFGDIIKSDIYPDLVIDSSQLNHIQYKKVADSRTAVSSASPASVPADLVENIVARELSTTGWRHDPLQPASQECSRSADEPAKEAVPAAMTDPGEVKAFILEHFSDLAAARNKGQLMKAAMSALKGRAESRIVNEAVAELCK